jgi:hypothetical protein
MTHWIHMVGRAYYRSADAFAAEAGRYGVTRRVARGTAERMEYGDTVWLAIQQGKSVVVFGKFVVSSLSGLSPEEANKLAEGFDLVSVEDGGFMVSRGCGSYITGGTFAIVSKDGKPVTLKAALEQIAGVEPKGKLMIGGEFIPTTRVRLKSVKFSQGFRPFDANAYTNALRICTRDSKPLVVKGFFYSEAGNEGNVEYLDERRAQVVGDYRRKGDE